MHAHLPKRPRVSPAIARLASLWACCGFMGCAAENPGTEPPRATLNFPIAMGVAADQLLVANSNFNLRYNQGSLMALSLPRVRQAMQNCSANSPCSIRDITSLLNAEVWLGSHARSLAVGPVRALDGRQVQRLYLAIRSESDLTYVDLDTATGSLACGQNQNPLCDDAHRHLTLDSSCGRTLTGGTDAVSVVVGSQPSLGMGNGTYGVVLYRNGLAGLFVDNEANGRRPTLVDMLRGLPVDLERAGLQDGRVWVANLAIAITRWTRELARFDIVADATCPALVPAPRMVTGRLDVGGDDQSAQDLRDFAFADDRVFVLSRRPEMVVTLLPHESGHSTAEIALGKQYPVPSGPSRMTLGRVGGTTDGHRILAVASYDARAVTLIDIDEEVVIDSILGLNGPHELVFDPEAPYLYVAEFRDSVVRVISLNERSVIATLGIPRPIQILR